MGPVRAGLRRRPGASRLVKEDEFGAREDEVGAAPDSSPVTAPRETSPEAAPVAPKSSVGASPVAGAEGSLTRVGRASVPAACGAATRGEPHARQNLSDSSA
jgi:hypothetical protein